MRCSIDRSLLVSLTLVCTLASPAISEDRKVVVDRPDTSSANDHYAGNRSPLLASPLIKLPTGSIKPRGWLRKQLELEADGFTGHLTEISGFCRQEGNAWLHPKGEGHGTWEEVPYWFRGFIALGYVLDDPRIIKASQPWIENLFASQQPDGYFGPPKNRGDEKHGPDLMPNMNMLFALRSYYEATSDRRVLDLMTRYFRWELTIPDKLFFSHGWQVPRNGDNLDSVYWLYNRTGEPFLLELAAKLQRCGASWMNLVTGGHNVDFSQGFRKPALFYQQNRDPKFLEATEKNWESIMGLYGQVPGGMFGGDEFARPGYTDPRQAIETCGAVEMMISEQILLQITGDPQWADRCEDVAFNTLPATMTADLKALRYLTSPNQVNSDARSKAPELADAGPMQVMNPHDHRCCQHNAGAGWPYFADRLWYATPGNGLAAVFYAASTVKAKVGGGTTVTIEEQTQYPFAGTVTFTVTADAPVAFPLYLRVPGWCGNPSLEINGQGVPGPGRPGAYLCVDRTWQQGDRLTLRLPQEIRLTTWEKNQNAVSVHRGPLTFSLKIAERYVRYEPQRFADPWPAWQIIPTTPWNYAIQADAANPGASFQVVTKPWPASDMPFTHDGTPVELRVQARWLLNWKEDHLGLVDKLQPSPVKSTEPLESVTLIPMGAARLRLAAIPVLGDGPEAREWQLPAEPLTSYSRGLGSDPYDAMFDGKVPQNSNDRSGPRFTTYCFGGAEHGKLHWVQKKFDQETTVSSCEVYWYDESQPLGDVRLPKWWRVLYKSGAEWQEVENPSGYGIERDQFNVVTFTPVKTTALRLDVQCQNEQGRWAMGILEWRIK